MTVTKAFGPNPILAGGTTKLTITIANQTSLNLTGVGMYDNFPAGRNGGHYDVKSVAV